MKGMAFPGYIYISGDGRIQQTFFEQNYQERYTANNVIAKLFPELAEADLRTLAAPHLQLKLGQSDSVVGPGSRVTLTIEVTLPKDMHVYAPGAKGYKPIALQLDPSRELKLGCVRYPMSRILFFASHQRKDAGVFRDVQDHTRCNRFGRSGIYPQRALAWQNRKANGTRWDAVLSSLRRYKVLPAG